MTEPPNIVIGAGPAGLAMMAELKRRALPFLGVESFREIGGLWNVHNPATAAYDSLVTNSSKSTTFLDRKAPGSWPAYLTREHAHRYLEDFAARHRLSPDIRFDCEVERVTRLDSGRWAVRVAQRRSGATRTITGRSVIACTGVHSVRNGYVPPDLVTVMGSGEVEVIHSSRYKNSTPYRGRTVLIVGFGNSAADIATEVSRVAARTLMSTRTLPWIVPLWVCGLPADRFRNLARGSRVPPGMQNRVFRFLQNLYVGHPKKLGMGEIGHDILDRLPVSDRGIMQSITRGRIRLRGGVRAVRGNTVYFEDAPERGETVDHIIAATGYRRDYPFLDDGLRAPLDDDHAAFPLLIFHPVEERLFFMSEVSVPQSGWPLYAKQASAIASYLEAEIDPGAHFTEFNGHRGRMATNYKGRLFRCADRFHVDPDVYGSHLERFSRWIKG